MRTWGSAAAVVKKTDSRLDERKVEQQLNSNQRQNMGGQVMEKQEKVLWMIIEFVLNNNMLIHFVAKKSIHNALVSAR